MTGKKNESQEYFRGTEVAKMFSVTWRTVYRWIESGELHAEKDGQYKITRADIDEFVKNRERRKQIYYSRK